MIDDAIKRTKERLVKVKRQRSTQRRQRERTAVFNVSLVGYTNAGKSTLFNALVKARAYAADQLFATLDTTTRQMYLEAAGCSVSLSDTVGFIRDLPHGLVAAFQATLQEAVDADLLLHVVDAANPHYPEQIQQVQKVLREIGADEIPQILVFNKLDAMNSEERPGVLKDSYDLEGRQVVRLFLSARNAQGLEALRTELAERVLEARLTTMSPELDAPLQDTPDDWAQSPGQP
jgi:GTP-binding protein HflX